MDHHCVLDHGQFQQLMTGCDIVKRGTLYVKHLPSFLPAALNIQPWKKRFVVLRDAWYCNPCVVTSLDIYDSEPASLTGCHSDCGSSRSRHEPYSVDLRQLTAVGFHLESRRFQFAFYVERCNDRPLLFATECDLEMRCWVAALRMLADKARLGVKMCPDGRRSIPTASPATFVRRRTLPTDSVAVPVSLVGRRRNLSEPQLHAVPSALRRFTHSGQQHAGLQRKLTAPAVSSMNEMDDESLLETDSPGGATAAAADGDNSHHRLRRMFSTSVLGSLLGSGRRKAFSVRRKDSGFSESFDEEPTTDTDGQDSPATSSPPPTPPPRPPPRRNMLADDQSTSPLLRRPLPLPLPGVTGEQNVVERTPPTPPPRPPHTLLPLDSQ